MEKGNDAALFRLEGPDEDGCVWACSADGRDMWRTNLGLQENVTKVLSQWLSSNGHAGGYQRANPG